MTDYSLARRGVLAGLSAGIGGVAGCVGTLGAERPRVSILAAGSLNNALENGLRPSIDVDVDVEVEAHGSAEVARLVAEGQKAPDIVSVADVALFESPLRPAWFAEFATNSVVLAYNPNTAGGTVLADAGVERWYRPILNGEVALGRTDPDLDPLGYRALFVLELATAHYGLDVDLHEAVPRREQLYPETQLISQFETGSIDAAIAYRNMAVERGYDFIELPVEVDLSDPAYADHYATATYELPGGTVVRGGPISYGATLRRRSPPAVDVFGAHVAGQYLHDFGFGVPDDYPRFTGDVPDAVAN